jgi:predicted RecA/RadA family phage recombinase
MQNYVHKGVTLSVTAPYNVTSGGGCLIGGLIFGIAATTALSGAAVEIEVEGVYDLAKDTSTFVEGAQIFWDNVALVATSKQAAAGTGMNVHIGVAELVQASGTNALGGASGDATVRVRLNAKFGVGSGLQRAHATYNFANDGGAIGLITPLINTSIPAKAIIVGTVFNATTTVVGAGASIAAGTSAGSSASALLAATAITSFAAGDFVTGLGTFILPVKLTAAGLITVTVSADALTAGVVEIDLFYYLGNS